MFGMLMLVIMILGILGLVDLLRWLRSQRYRLDDGRSAASDAQLARIESALALLESRLDDVQDQQRFLERLLAERPAKDALPPSREKPEPRPDRVDSILFDTDREEP